VLFASNLLDDRDHVFGFRLVNQQISTRGGANQIGRFGSVATDYYRSAVIVEAIAICRRHGRVINRKRNNFEPVAIEDGGHTSLPATAPDTGSLSFHHPGLRRKDWDGCDPIPPIEGVGPNETVNDARYAWRSVDRQRTIAPRHPALRIYFPQVADMAYEVEIVDYY